MGSHRDLHVWQRAHRLAIRVHRETAGRVVRDAPSLADQLRRSTESIGDNIAEGRGVGTKGVYLRHLRIALGSAAEADSQLVRLRDGGTLPPEVVLELLDELAVVRRLLLALERAIKARPRQTSPAVPRAKRAPRSSVVPAVPPPQFRGRPPLQYRSIPPPAVRQLTCGDARG